MTFNFHESELEAEAAKGTLWLVSTIDHLINYDTMMLKFYDSMCKWDGSNQSAHFFFPGMHTYLS